MASEPIYMTIIKVILLSIVAGTSVKLMYIIVDL